MPSLPNLSGREVIRIFEKQGYMRMRQRGSHVVMRKGSIVCVIPDHREIKTGTLSGIIRQAGISPVVFWEWIKKY